MSKKGYDVDELQVQIQHRLIEELNQSERRYQGLMDVIPVVVFQLDEEDRFTFLNPAWSRYSKKSVSETVGLAFSEVMEPHSGITDPNSTAPELWRLQTQDGERLIMEVAWQTSSDDRRIGTMHDVTVARNASAELLSQKQHLADVNLRLKEMTQTLDRQKGSLEELVDQRTAQLRAANLELSEASRAQEEVHRQKVAFFQNVAHELRTPVALLINPLQKLAGKFPEEPELQMALRNSDRLKNLVDQTLDFERLSSISDAFGTLHPVNLGVLAERCVSEVQAISESGAVSIMCALQGQIVEHKVLKEAQVFVQGDVGALEKTLFNLVSNAMKYIGSGDTVVVGLSVHENRVHLSVEDNGPGISPDLRAQIFHPFFRLPKDVQSGTTGTGLGLSIVKSFVEGMNGSIAVESEEGGGTKFVCTFVQSERFESDEVDRALGKTTQDRALMSIEDEGKQLEFLEAPYAIGTILVVDDVCDMRVMVGSRLLDWGYSVYLAADAETGLNVVYEHDPDLVITDWMLPGMSGPDLLEQIKGHGPSSSTPTILLTAKTDRMSRDRGLGAGADVFLGKPFGDDELKTALRNLWRLKEQERKLKLLNDRIEKDVLRRYLAPSLVDEIIEGRLAFDSEPKRSVITVMFVDLVGFTELSERLRADRAAHVVNTFFDEMNRVIFEHEGTIDKFLGDGIMVLFGSPSVLEPDRQVRLAVQCARAMHHAMDIVNDKCNHLQEYTLEIRVGIHHGPAMVGNFGSKERVDYSAIGPTVNLAARLEAVCAPNETYVSGEVVDFLQESEFEFVGKFEFKGINSARHIFQLTASE